MFPFFWPEMFLIVQVDRYVRKFWARECSKKEANKFSWLEMFQHFCGQKCSTVFFFFFSGPVRFSKNIVGRGMS